jgi:hypothetical protein
MSAEVRGPRSDDRGPHDRLDLAIDRAVREMLDVEPPADLRARVMQRVAGQRRDGSRTFFNTLVASGFSRNRVIFAAAMAAVIVLTIFVARRNEPLPQAPVVAPSADQRLPVETPTMPSTTEAPVRRAATASRVSRVPSPPNTGTVIATGFRGDDHATTAIAPLKTIAPIAVAPIGQATIAPAEVAVRPLNTISDIQIAPLTPPDRR